MALCVVDSLIKVTKWHRTCFPASQDHPAVPGLQGVSAAGNGECLPYYGDLLGGEAGNAERERERVMRRNG